MLRHVATAGPKLWVALLTLAVGCAGGGGPAEVASGGAEDGAGLADVVIGGREPTDGPVGPVEELLGEELAGPSDGSGLQDGPAGDGEATDGGREPPVEVIAKPDLPPPPPDGDNDLIPDDFDPFPTDPERPGMASAMSVYMHTSSALWKLDVKSHDITKVGDFKWPSFWESGQMTDIAIDRHGVLYGVTFDDLFVCHPQEAKCWKLGALPDSFNGLTLVPQGLIDDHQDTLIGISEAGGWYRLTVSGSSVIASQLGSFGGPYSSSGDAYSIVGAGTFAAANKSGSGSDVLVQLDPATGKVTSEVGPLTGYDSVFGLAGWTGKAYAFDAGGDITVVDTATGQVLEVLKKTKEVWWGAGVRTLIF